MIIGFFKTPWQHRELIARLSRRDIVAKYRGSFLGLAWVIIEPLMLLMVYTLFLGTFIKARWATDGVNNLTLSLVLFVGLNCYNFFSDALSKAPNLIHGNSNYVKKIIFPVDVLPWVLILSSLIQTMITFFILIIWYGFTMGFVPITSLCLLPLLLAMTLFMLGGIYYISSLSVYIRDTGYALKFFITAMLFLSPVFYRMDAMSPTLQSYLYLNPLAFMIEQARVCLMEGKMINCWNYLIFLLIGLGFALLGYAWFQKTKVGFADVL